MLEICLDHLGLNNVTLSLPEVLFFTFMPVSGSVSSLNVCCKWLYIWDQATDTQLRAGLCSLYNLFSLSQRSFVLEEDTM